MGHADELAGASAGDVTVTEGLSPGVRGLSLFWRAWRPPAPRARVVIVHGYGEHGGRYERLAVALANHRYAVIAPDHRGHGRSEGRPISVASFDDYVDDLHRLLERGGAGAGGGRDALPLFMLGHSMGGLIALAFALRHERELAGLILSAPAVIRPADVSPSTIRAGRILARIAPEMGTVRLPVHLISRDPAVVSAYNQDPLVHRRRLRARLGAEMLRVIELVGARLSDLHLPALMVQGTEDGVVDPAAARFVYDRLGSSDRTLHEYLGLYHEVFNEPEHERVTGDVLTWLAAH